jgi:hypothetical protein
MRADHTAHPSAFEEGLACALRTGIPLVVGGSPFVDPYVEYASAVAESEDVVDACVEAAERRRTDRHATRARAELREILAGHDFDPAAIDVVVSRRGAVLDVVVTVPPAVEHALHRAITTRLVQLLRALDPTRQPQIRVLHMPSSP